MALGRWLCHFHNFVPLPRDMIQFDCHIITNLNNEKNPSSLGYIGRGLYYTVKWG